MNGRVLPVWHLPALYVTDMCSTSHTVTQIEPLRNTLGIIKALYNFLEASPKRHSLLSVTEVQGEDPPETDSMVMPVGSLKGRIRANRTRFKSPAHAVFRQRSEKLL